MDSTLAKTEYNSAQTAKTAWKTHVALTRLLHCLGWAAAATGGSSDKIKLGSDIMMMQCKHTLQTSATPGNEEPSFGSKQPERVISFPWVITVHRILTFLITSAAADTVLQLRETQSRRGICLQLVSVLCPDFAQIATIINLWISTSKAEITK